MRRPAPAPGFGRVGQFQPVPLGFITRWVRDDGVGAFGGGATGLADRAQVPLADVAGQALIRQPESQLLKFVEQRAGPQMRVLNQAGGDVVDERVERIRRRPRTHPGFFTVQIFADRLSVTNPVWRAIAEIDQPRLRRACTSTSSSHVSMRKRASFNGAIGVRHQQHRRRPALLGGATRVGNFDERQWGNSTSAVTDDHSP